MQSLDLNLASRPFKNNTLPWSALWVAALLLGALTVSNVRAHWKHASLLADLADRVGGIESHREDLEQRDGLARRAIEKFDLEVLNVRAKKANEVIRWKAFSWTRLFNRLEEVVPWEVQMSSIYPTFRPEGDSDSARNAAVFGVPVVVEGTARNLMAFLEFERALIRSPHFSRIEPERTDVDEQTRETVFGLRFVYDPEVPEGPPPAPAAEAEEAPATEPNAPGAAADDEIEEPVTPITEEPLDPDGVDPTAEGR